jgi:hypothetical protein
MYWCFLSHVLITNWIPARSSAPPVRSTHPPSRILPDLYKASIQPVFTLKMAAAEFAETLNNFQHSTLLIPESRSCTLNSSCENLRTRMNEHFHKVKRKGSCWHAVGEESTYLVRFQVLTAASMNMTVFWDVTPCSLVEIYQRFRGAYCPHHRLDGGGSKHL